MAALTINKTIPDAKVAALVDAVNWQWGTALTAAQINDEIGNRLVVALQDIYKRHQEYLREQGAIDGIVIT